MIGILMILIGLGCFVLLFKAIDFFEKI